MNREVRTALGGALGLVVLIVAFVALVRYLVPSILGAPFSFSLIAAVTVAVLGVLVLCWAGWRLWVWVVRSFNR
jgi:pilus assembly protein TadC